MEYPACTRVYISLVHNTARPSGVPALMRVDIADAENWVEFHLASEAEEAEYRAWQHRTSASFGPVQRSATVV